MNLPSANSSPARGAPVPPPDQQFFIVLPDGSCTPATRKVMAVVLRQARSEASKAVRIQRQEQAARLHRNLQDKAAARGILREMAETDRGIAKWHRIKGRIIPDKPTSGTSPVTKRTSRSASLAPLKVSAAMPLTASSWAIDAAGFRGVTWQQTYIGRSSPKFRRGAAKENWEYECRDEAVLRDAAGEPVISSNMGDDWLEIGTAWQCLEDASTRKNAKIQLRVIAPFDADASQDEKVAAIKHFATTVLEPLNLPYSAVIHEPSAQGDQRNYHAHISFSLRPMRRIEPYNWEVADEVRGELDGKAGVQILRHLWAHSMTEAANKFGREMQYTGLGFGARGLDHESGEHLGEALTAMARRGQYVPAQERNRIKAERNRFRSRMRDLDKKIEALSAVRYAVLKDLEHSTAEPALWRLVSADAADRVQPSLAGTLAFEAKPAPSPLMSATVSSPSPIAQLTIAQTASSRQILATAITEIPVDRPSSLRPTVSVERPQALLRPTSDLRSAPGNRLFAADRATAKPLLAGAATGTTPRYRATNSPSKIDRPTILRPAPGFSSNVHKALSSADHSDRPAPQYLTLPIPSNSPLLTAAAADRTADPVSAVASTLLAELRQWRVERDAAASPELAIGAAAPLKSDPTQTAHPPAITTSPHAARTTLPLFAGPARRKQKRKQKRPMTATGEAMPLATREWHEAHPRQAFDTRRTELNPVDQAIMDRIVAEDLYVVANGPRLTLDKWAVAALEPKEGWINQPDIQIRLAGIRSGQQRIMANAYTTYGVGLDGNSTLPDGMSGELRKRLERWSDIDGFADDLRTVQQRYRQPIALKTVEAKTENMRSDARPHTDHNPRGLDR